MYPVILTPFLLEQNGHFHVFSFFLAVNAYISSSLLSIFFFFFVVAFKHAVCGYLNTCTCLNVCVCTYVPGVAGAVVGTSCEVTCVIFFFFSFSLLLDTVAG